MSLNERISEFVQNVVNAMGLTLSARIEESPEATRINLEGDDAGVLTRRGGEVYSPLRAASGRIEGVAVMAYDVTQAAVAPLAESR